MTRTSIQTSFHRIETGLHHVPSNPQFLNSSRRKHHLFLIILLKCFCDCRHSEENIYFLPREEHPEQKWWTLSASFGICHVITNELRTSLPISFSFIIHNFTNKKSLSVDHLGSKSSRYEPNRDRRAVNKHHLHWHRLQQGFVWGSVLAR